MKGKSGENAEWPTRIPCFTGRLGLFPKLSIWPQNDPFLHSKKNTPGMKTSLFLFRSQSSTSQLHWFRYRLRWVWFHGLWTRCWQECGSSRKLGFVVLFESWFTKTVVNTDIQVDKLVQGVWFISGSQLVILTDQKESLWKYLWVVDHPNWSPQRWSISRRNDLQLTSFLAGERVNVWQFPLAGGDGQIHTETPEKKHW